jgi:hypothetical protein
MKLMPILLINVVTVGAGIALYDHFKGEPEPAVETAMGGLDTVDLAALEDRIMERVNAGQPGLKVAGTNPSVLARLDALESRASGAPAPVATESAPGETGSAPAGTFAAPDLAGGTGEPTEDEVRRFRKIMERAEEMRRDERDLQRLDGMLTRLEITLDLDQKKKLLTAQRDFRRKVSETWRNAMRDGGGRDAARAAMDGLREEFTTEITKFMSIGDAQKISEQGAGMMRAFGGDIGMGGARRRGDNGAPRGR